MIERDKAPAPQTHLRVALTKIADMIDDENADLDDAIDIARAALAKTSEEGADGSHSRSS